MENLPLEIVNNILLIRYKENLKELDLLKKQYEHLKKDNDNMSTYMYNNQIDMCEQCGIYDDDSIECIEYQEIHEQYLCQDCFISFQRLSPHENDDS